MASKRSHAAMNVKAVEEEPVDPSDELMFLALGGGNEVGRSSHIIQYKGKTIMLDAGVHASYEGFAGMPFYDEFDLSTVDVLLISHFHMDHAGTLPYVLAKTNFAGRVYMTHPTKAIYKWLVQDAVRVRNTRTSTVGGSGSDGVVSELFTEEDIFNTLPAIQTVSFNTTHTHNGIRMTPYPAGHVLGACMWHIEIAGLSVLFTGDYSREVDRHLIPAAIPAHIKVDCLITESTFGISTHVPRAEREAGLMKCVTGILNRGGRALLPSASVGNTQEILLILEDYWRRHEEYRKFPIYYASALARKCMVVYQTYIDAMNDNIRSQYQLAQKNTDVAGPWDFQFVRSLKSLERFDDVGACVMMAAPGMLQNGVSRTLLERWAPDPKNGVVITGYSVEGTMAKQIMLEPDSIPALTTNRQNMRGILDKRALIGADQTVMIPRRCSVNEFSFAVHVDGQENREFIEEVNAPVVILVHGEKHNMGRLKSRLLSSQKMKVYSPVNCEEVRIPFKRDKIARVVGSLASRIKPPALPSPPTSPEDGEDGEEVKRRKEDTIMSGILVQSDFNLQLMDPEDLKEYAGLTTTTILCRQRITLQAAGVGLIKWALEGTFGSVHTVSRGSEDEDGTDKVEAEEEVETANGNRDELREDETVFEVLGGAVRVRCRPHGETVLEWQGNMTNDSVADSILAVLMSVESSPAAVKQSSKMHSHSHHHHHRHEHDHDRNGDHDDDRNGKGSIEEEAEQMPRNLHANLSADERLSRIFMFLEAQFGEDAISPITEPKISATRSSSEEEEEEDDEQDSVTREKLRAQELARLHELGVPVPGICIQFDKLVAKVWLEKLEVECANKSLADRIKAVMDRACETVAPIWM